MYASNATEGQFDLMSSSTPSQTPSQEEAWDKMFNFDPTTSPFFPQSNAESNLDLFAAQPLFLPEVYLPQPNFYPEQLAPQMQIGQMLPHEPATGSKAVEEVAQGGTFDAIRGDLDKVIMSVWQLKNDYQKRIHDLDHEVAQASKAAEGLRKDVDAIGGWVQQVVQFLNDTSNPSELPAAEKPDAVAQEDPGVGDQDQEQ